MAEVIESLPSATREVGLRLESDLVVFSYGSLAASAAACERRTRFSAGSRTQLKAALDAAPGSSA